MKKPEQNKKSGTEKDKKEDNKGSGSFNQGSEQEPDYKNGVSVSDEEKKTGKPPSKLLRQNQNAQQTGK